MSDEHGPRHKWHFPLNIVSLVEAHGAQYFAAEPSLIDVPLELHAATRAWSIFIYSIAYELEKGNGCPVIIVFINALDFEQRGTAMWAATRFGYDHEIYCHGQFGWYILLTKFGFRTMDYDVM
jgi:hypothetical protein